MENTNLEERVNEQPSLFLSIVTAFGEALLYGMGIPLYQGEKAHYLGYDQPLKVSYDPNEEFSWRKGLF